MKILYVAKHGSGLNDDEGAIAYALEQLGHGVIRAHEKHYVHLTDEADLLLFHKWDDVEAISRFKGRKAFWYFDLVEWPSDPTLAGRCRSRVEWMRKVIPHVDLGFCTDGDWVHSYNLTHAGHRQAVDLGPKLVWLPQGADERVVGRGIPLVGAAPILFVGNRTGGEQRRSFVREMEETWGKQFHCIEKGVYGRELAPYIAGAKVVVAPDSPVTDRYWSNRAYVMLGFGALLLHPWSQGLSDQCRFLPFYRSREQMHTMIDRVLCEWWKGPLSGHAAGIMTTSCLDEVREKHLYRHRCADLIRAVEKLG